MKRAVTLSLFVQFALLTLLFSVPVTFTAQAGDLKIIHIDGGKLVGKVVESPNNTGVSFATIALLAKDSSLANGAVAD